MEYQIAHIRQLIDAGDVKKAEVTIAHALRENMPDKQQAEILMLRARIRLLASRPDEAADDLEEVQHIQPELFSIAVNLELLADCYVLRFEVAAMSFARKSDLREASVIYHRILKESPDYSNLGWIYYQQGRIALIEGQAFAAEGYFHKALFSPSTVSALTAYCYERLGFVAYYESRQPKRAVMYLNKALDTYPASESTTWLVQVYLLRSRVLREADLDAALESAQKAYQLASASPINKSLSAESLFTMAELFAQKSGQETELIDCLQRFMQTSKIPVGVDVTWSRAHEMLGDAHFALEQYDAAVVAYENTLQYNPDHPWEETIRYRLARAYYHHQQYTHTINTLQPLLQETTHYRVYHLLANAFFALAQYPQAAQAYAAGIHLAPPGTDTQTMQTYYELSQRINPPL